MEAFWNNQSENYKKHYSGTEKSTHVLSRKQQWSKTTTTMQRSNVSAGGSLNCNGGAVTWLAETVKNSCLVQTRKSKDKGNGERIRFHAFLTFIMGCS